MNPTCLKPFARAGSLRIAPLACVLALAACDIDSLVDVPDRDITTLPIVQDTSNLPILRNGVVFEFARALSGPGANNATPGITGLSGLFTDELWYSSTLPSAQQFDARDIDERNGDLLAVFRFLHRARALGENAAALFAASPRANSEDHALVTNLAGYVYVFLAENFCSGVPISLDPFGAPVVYGAGLSTAQLLDRAIDHFDDASNIAQQSGSTEQRDLARVGKARALLVGGNFAEAAAIAGDVDPDFEYLTTYGEVPAPQNGVWFNINAERRSSAASEEGFNGIRFFDPLAVEATIDPRVPVDFAGFGLGTDIESFIQHKYENGAADIPLATGLEARLIVAENLLNGGQSDGYLGILNSLRGDIGLGPLADPGAPRDRVLQFFQERALWLWLTAHRLGDMRRMMRHYGFTEEEVFPVGLTIFNAVYGADVNFPIPFVEQNNPNYSGQCIDREA